MNIVATEQQRKKMHPHKFTLWVAIASIIMMFAGLTSAFIVKRNAAGYTGVDLPVYFWISTATILLSSVTMIFGVRAFKERRMQQYRQLVAITFILGIAFVVFQWLGFKELWDNQGVIFRQAVGAGQFMYVIFGLHAIHVLGGIIALMIMFIKAFAGKTKLYSAVPVEVAATYWHFVDLLWIYLLVFFLLVG